MKNYWPPEKRCLVCGSTRAHWGVGCSRKSEGTWFCAEHVPPRDPLPPPNPSCGFVLYGPPAACTCGACDTHPRAPKQGNLFGDRP